MTAAMESVGRRIRSIWAWLCHAAVAAWGWIAQQWEAMMRQSAGEESPRQARRAEKQRRKEIRRQLKLKERAVRQAA
jgi:hypothetical protein